MTLKEQLYRFENLEIHDAITIQMSLDDRKMNITTEGSDVLKGGEKVIKAVIDEIDQMYDDLDRHIAAINRMQDYEKRSKNNQAQQDALFRSEK